MLRIEPYKMFYNNIKLNNIELRQLINEINNLRKLNPIAILKYNDIQ